MDIELKSIRDTIITLRLFNILQLPIFKDKVWLPNQFLFCLADGIPAMKSAF